MPGTANCRTIDGGLTYLTSKLETAEMATKDKREERLEARCSTEVKQRIERAAELQGRSLTDFLVSAADERACKVIEQYQVVKLTVQQSEALADALLNPPAANAKAVNAMLRYKKKMGGA